MTHITAEPASIPTGRTTRAARAHMVERQLRRRGIRDSRVLAAMGAVPRELFVPPGLRGRAYDDTALPIAAGQTISQPYMVAMMLQLARITANDCVLEVGAGSGYGAAVMAHMARQVTVIERHHLLVVAARINLAQAGIRRVAVIEGDGTRGLPRLAPFDAIVVSAAGPLPAALPAQLAIGGRLVMPLGTTAPQTLVRITRRSATAYGEEAFGPVAFVPLITDLA